MKHVRFNYIRTLIEADENVLLVGEAGTGKTTIAIQVAKDLGLDFYTMSMTKQTAVSALLGFISINGTYIPSQLRKAYEYGGLMLLDEIDAADPNVLLALNTIENGFISFPDGIIKAHPNFKLIATANPMDAHSTYTGRSKLDFSTLDRYHTVSLDRDDILEQALVYRDIYTGVQIARELLKEMGITSTVTMRDSLRLDKLYKLNIEEPFKEVVFRDYLSLYPEFLDKYTKQIKKEHRTQAECKTFDELWETINFEKETYEDK